MLGCEAFHLRGDPLSLGQYYFLLPTPTSDDSRLLLPITTIVSRAHTVPRREVIPARKCPRSCSRRGSYRGDKGGPAIQQIASFLTKSSDDFPAYCFPLTQVTGECESSPSDISHSWSAPSCTPRAQVTSPKRTTLTLVVSMNRKSALKVRRQRMAISRGHSWAHYALRNT